MKILLTLALTTLLSGCASPIEWERINPIADDTTAAEKLTEAKSVCKAEADPIFPVKKEVSYKTLDKRKRYREPKSVYRSCHRVNSARYRLCQSENEMAEISPWKEKEIPAMMEKYVVDVNKGSRQHMFNGCMRQKGWKVR